MSAAVQERLYCPKCGYDLRGIESARCPECGTDVNRATLAVSRIAWVHRKELGRVRAFWKTTWMALVRPGKLAEDMALPADLGAAQAYRRVVVWLNVFPMLPVLYVLFQVTGNRADEMFFPALWMQWLVGILFGGALLALLSGAHLMMFHPRSLPVELQNRAVALGHYCCAPMMLFWPWAGVMAGAWWFIEAVQSYHLPEWWGIVVGVAAMVGLPLIILVRSWTLVLYMIHKMTRGSGMRLAVCAVLLPLLWGACVVLAMTVPVTAVLLELMRQSFS